ncbi:MAG: hypothetical protein U5Q44_00605 [Dehalococcoidia bacterium]|nr:hypothetical protein [Dehalococcoidia bacterium]
MSGLLDQIRMFFGRLRPHRGDGAAGWVEPENSVTRAIMAAEARQHFQEAGPPPAPPTAEPEEQQPAPAATSQSGDGEPGSHRRGSAA